MLDARMLRGWHSGLVPRCHLSFRPARRGWIAKCAYKCAAAATEAPTAAQQQLPRSTKPAKLQTLDCTALTACVLELQQQWVPSKVEQVVQPDKQCLCLRLRTPNKSGWLHVSWQQTSGRICIGSSPSRGGVAEAFSFGQQVHAALQGAVLLQASMPHPWERVAQLRFGPRLGPEHSHDLIIELMGRYSNLVVTDALGVIQQCAFQVGGHQSSRRQLQQGRRYELPPAAAGLEPDAGQEVEGWRAAVGAAAGTVASGLVKAYQGVSPSLAGELCQQAGVQTSASPAELPLAQWQALHSAWQAWLEALQAGRFEPGICRDSGTFSVLGKCPSQPSALAMIDEYYSSLQVNDEAARLQQSISNALQRAVKRVRGRIAGFQQQLQAAADVGSISRQADLLMAGAHSWQPGEPVLEVEDWDTGELVKLDLGESESPIEAAEALYVRARKRRRGADKVRPLLEVAQGELSYLQELEWNLTANSDAEVNVAALQGLQEELVAARYMKPPAEAVLQEAGRAKGRKAAKRQGLPSAEGFREFTSPSGFQVLIGRNNKQNDQLSCRLAKAGDVWMHARGCPGAHLVLRMQPGREAAAQDLQFAADLAAYFSKARSERRALVTVADPKDIKKPRGAPLGLVSVSKERTLVGSPDNSHAAQSTQVS